MGLHHLLEDLKRTARLHGRVAALHEFAAWAANKVADVQIMKAVTVHVEDVADPELFHAPGYEGRFATAEELAPYAETGEQEFSLAFMRRAFARGDRCYALFHEGKLASHGWYSNRPTSIDAYFDLHFDPAYTYMYKGFTAPAHRGKRLHAVGMCRALRTVAGEGKRGLIAYVFSHNFASRRSGRRMGYRAFGTVVVVRMGSFAFAHATPGCNAHGFKLARRKNAEAGVGEAMKAS